MTHASNNVTAIFHRDNKDKFDYDLNLITGIRRRRRRRFNIRNFVSKYFLIDGYF